MYSHAIGVRIARYKKEGKTNKEIGLLMQAQLGLSEPMIKRTINNHHARFLRENAGHHEEMDTDFLLEKSSKIPESETTFQDKNERDLAEWKKISASYTHAGREIRVVALHDIHFPFCNFELLDVAYQAIYDFKPDIITLGSDEHDCATISKFPASMKERSKGLVKPAIEYHKRHVRNLISCAPNATKIYITGNHDLRWAEHVVKNPETGDATIDLLEQTWQYGDALFLGWKIDGFHIRSQNHRSLAIFHGHKANIHVAKSMFDNLPFDYLCFGHVHRRNLWEVGYSIEGEWYNRWAISTGALCEMIPHYAKAQHNNWQPGFAFIRFNTKTGEASHDQIQPNEKNEFYWGEKLYRPER